MALCVLPLLAVACATPEPQFPGPDALPPLASKPGREHPCAFVTVPSPVPARPQPDFRLRIEHEADIQDAVAGAVLASVAAAARADEELYVYVEGYAAGTGSLALKLGRNDRVLRLIRTRLLKEGTEGRRIYLYNRGEVDATADIPASHIEIFLVRG